MPFLVARVPGFADNLAEIRGFYGADVGAHIVMGEFTKYVQDLFRAHRAGAAESDEVRAALGVVEAFAASDDVGVKELAGVSFLENLGNDPELVEAMLPWMGPESRRLLSEIERFWRGET